MNQRTNRDETAGHTGPENNAANTAVETRTNQDPSALVRFMLKFKLIIATTLIGLAIIATYSHEISDFLVGLFK